MVTSANRVVEYEVEKTYVWSRVDKTEEPLVAAGITRVLGNAELIGEEQVGSIDNRLVHLNEKKR